MTPELEAALYNDFEDMFALRHEGITVSPMAFGFSCSDGWEPLIRALCEKITGKGITVHQVKEKFGGLRFYYHSDSTDEDFLQIEAAVHEAEERSYKTCERCGEPGTIDDTKGWSLTLCDTHKEERTATTRPGRFQGEGNAR